MPALLQPVFAYRRPPELDGGGSASPVVIVVGAGPVGLAAAIDLAQRGVPVLVLDDDDTVSVGSRAICYAKRTLEILDRLGCGEPHRRQGRAAGTSARSSRATRSPISSTCCPRPGHRRPAFVNLQQYHFEAVPGRARARAARRSSCAGATRSTAVRAARRRRDARRSRRPTATTRSTCDWLIACRRRAQPGAPHARPRHRGPGVPRPLPHRRHPHDVGVSRRALVLVRPAVPSATSRCCCIGRPTTCGASTSSSAGTPIPRWRSKPERIAAAPARDARRRRAVRRSSGRASTRSSAGACSAFATAACCSPAMRRTS